VTARAGFGDSVEALKAGVENLSVDSSAGSPVQAKVKIGRTTYPDDETRRGLD
jgi:hypothetical protein